MAPTAICSLGISVAMVNALQQCSCIVIPILPRTSDIDAQYRMNMLIACGVDMLSSWRLNRGRHRWRGGSDSRPPTGRNSGYSLSLPFRGCDFHDSIMPFFFGTGCCAGTDAGPKIGRQRGCDDGNWHGLGVFVSGGSPPPLSIRCGELKQAHLSVGVPCAHCNCSLHRPHPSNTTSPCIMSRLSTHFLAPTTTSSPARHRHNADAHRHLMLQASNVERGSRLANARSVVLSAS